MIEFLYPYLFILTVLYFICIKYCKKYTQELYFSNMAMLLKTVDKKFNKIKILQLLIILLIVTALASPVIKKHLKLNNTDGYEISLIVDASFSMHEFDKFEITKKIVSQFIEQRKYDKLALNIFADFAYTVSPLTYDKKSLQTSLKYIKIGVAGSKDTALYEALYKGVDIFKKSTNKNKIAILLTDGINTVNSIPLNIAIAKAKKYNIKIYTIGIGQKGDYNKKILQQIAKQTNAKFYETSNPKKLKQIYQHINKLEKSKITTTSYTDIKYLFQYPLILSIILFVILIIIEFKSKKNILYLYISFIFVLISVFRPTIYDKTININRQTTDIFIAFDISKSMMCTDIYPNRFEFSKNKFKQLINNTQNLKLSIMGFTNQTYLISPFTNDIANLDFMISNIDLKSIEQKGSNIFQLLKTLNSFTQQKNKNIIIFTDGTDQTNFLQEIKYAKKHKLKVYIYAVATNEGAAIPYNNEFIKDKNGNIVISSLNSQIETLALKSGGLYQKYSFNSNDLDIFIKKIQKNSNQKNISSSKLQTKKELYYIPLFISLIFFTLYSISFKRRKF